ncbi:hypothetical protein FBUS_00048, partial [Fasciolopsis buskii]
HTDHSRTKGGSVGPVHSNPTFHAPKSHASEVGQKVDVLRSRKSPTHRPPNKEECISDQFNYAILRGCLCYLFQSTGLSNGSFVSPQLEFLNMEQTTCLLFTFVGDLNEIVRLEFTQFLLDPKEPPRKNSADCRSYIRVFDSLGRAELNQNDQESFRFCGSERTLPQRVYYSAGRVLILEIHLDVGYSSPIDIRGRFQFESKGTSRENHGAKQWYSLLCNTAKENDRIEIRDLEPTVQFTKKIFLDQSTKDKLNAIKPVAVVCGRVSETHIVSDGTGVTVRFIANEPENWGGRVGFRGRFEFIGPHDSHVFSSQTRLITRQFESKDPVADQSSQTVGNIKQPIERHIKLQPNRMSAIIESPNYPRPYPENLQMLYIFHIPIKMRLGIKFFDFYLDDEDKADCDSSLADRLEVYDGAYPKAKRTLVFCGKHMPEIPSRKAKSTNELVSDNRMLTLRFVTDALRLGSERGFVISYTYSSSDTQHVSDAQMTNPNQIGTGKQISAQTEGLNSRVKLFLYSENLRCQSPVSVELVNYRPTSTQSEQEFKDMDDLLREESYGSRHHPAILPSHAEYPSPEIHGSGEKIPPGFAHSNLEPRLEPSDPVRLCADESVRQSPAALGFMSGNVPELDVVLRLDTPVFDEQGKSRLWSQLSDYLDLGYDIQYKFVTG